jgi:alkylated DNA repair dioxygenase AlkB
LYEAEEAELTAWIDAQPWDEELSRRRQFYGGSYGADDEFREVPAILHALAERLCDAGLLSEMPDRVLINEYFPGQGIAAHVDYHPRFGDEVAMVSLLDSYPMRFARGEEVYEKWLERRSACVISGPSRYEWTHEIARRLSDPVAGGRRMRGRRVSITFRKRVSL